MGQGEGGILPVETTAIPGTGKLLLFFFFLYPQLLISGIFKKMFLGDQGEC